MTSITPGAARRVDRTTSRRGRADRRRRLRVVEPASAAPSRIGRTGRRTAPIASAESQFGLGAAMIGLVIALSLIGSVMILSASSVAAVDPGGSPFGVFVRQCGWMVVGLIALGVGARLDYHRLESFVAPLMIGAVGLLVLVLVPGIGMNVNGAQRWIGVGAFQIQPAEPAKLALIVFIAALIGRERDRITDLRVVLRPVLVMLGVVVALLMLQPNLGTSSVICITVGIMLLWAGMPGRVLALLATLGLMGGAIFALSADYRRARVTAFMDPWADAGGSGYQIVQSLIGVASGGVTGTGLGASRAKWGFLPEAHTDFVFAIIGEELGLVGSLLVVALFAAMIVVGLRIAHRAADTFGTMLAVGVTAWFAVQAFVNVGAVLSLLPITGVPLPFVSFGGSSLLTTMLAAGILVNVALQSRAPSNAVRDRIAERRAANTARRHRAIAGR